MKNKVILASFCRPDKEKIDGVPVWSHPSFHVMPLHWIRASALADEEVSSRYNLEILPFDMDESNEEVLRKIWEQNPAMVSFSCHMWNLKKTLGICKRLKIVLPSVTIVLGGPEVSDYEYILGENPFVDIVVLGEGEETFLQLLKSFPGVEDVAGICFNREGRIASNAPGKPPVLDSLPSPYDRSFVEGLSGLVLYGTSRGCSFKCRFCSWCHSPKRHVPIDRVENELKRLLSNRNIKCIWFSDSEMDLKSERTSRILRFIRDNNEHGTRMFAFFDLLGADQESMKLCREANFSDSPVIGLQSSNQELHNTSGRKWFNVKKLGESLPVILKYFPSASFDVIYGLPGDTYEGFKQTLGWCLKNGIGNINFHRFMVTPGTEFSRNSDKYGIVFDRDVPHLSYSCDTYSYSDIVKMESLANNFKILMSLLQPADAGFFESRKIDLLEVMEEIHGHFSDWDRYFVRKQEYDIEGIDEDVIEPVKSYFLRVSGSEEIYRDIGDLLLRRQREKGMTDEVSAQPAADLAREEELKGHAAKLIAPFKVNDRFLGDWILSDIYWDSGIVYAFRWKDASFKIKLTKRDDSAPRLSCTKNFNIFYLEEDGIGEIPEEDRRSLLDSFVETVKKNESSHSLLVP